MMEFDPRWAQLVARDASANGIFFYGVVTTGVYCLPSCGARRPNPRNVRFFASCAEAEAAGLRACKRCRPGQPNDVIPRICRLIEGAEEQLNLATLARAAGLSASHFHRMFKAATGVTPLAYAAARRAERVRQGLAEEGSVTAALYQAGFNSSSRFYDQAPGMLGMTPAAYRAGGAGQEVRFAVGETSLGALVVAGSELGICAILLGDDPDALVRELQDRFPRARLIGGDAAFEQWVARVVGLVERPQTSVDLPLDVRGTAFQRQVWQALREIPAGTTSHYSEIAQRIGAPRAVRAVASACAANALAVAIPCHRVVRRDGDLAGYRWGIARKRALLAREAGDG